MTNSCFYELYRNPINPIPYERSFADQRIPYVKSLLEVHLGRISREINFCKIKKSIYSLLFDPLLRW